MTKEQFLSRTKKTDKAPKFCESSPNPGCFCFEKLIKLKGIKDLKPKPTRRPLFCSPSPSDLSACEHTQAGKNWRNQRTGERKRWVGIKNPQADFSHPVRELLCFLFLQPF